MKEENSKYLASVYPKIFSGKYGGFAVGDGWFNIINMMCRNIQHHIDWKNRDSEVVPQVVAEQVKEKFGTLRFYYQGGDDYVHGLVSMAESMTEVTCEECGDPGQSRGDGWIHVYCNTCEAEHEMNKLRREGFEE